MSERLVLGTVQLGLPYGINNAVGKPDLSKAESIVRCAYDHGVVTFDTAQSYGDSEKVLGHVFASLGIEDRVKVYSKFADKAFDLSDVNGVSRSIEASLECLKVPALEGLMLHDEDLLDQWGSGLFNSLAPFIRREKVKSLGVSVYSPIRAKQALALPGISFVQVPSNICDKRFESAGVFDLARAAGKKIFVRSVFLQGLLLMEERHVPKHLASVVSTLQAIRVLSSTWGMSVADLALAYAYQRWSDAGIIFGAESYAQVEANVDAVKIRLTPIQMQKIESDISTLSEEVLNPSLWQK